MKIGIPPEGSLTAWVGQDHRQPDDVPGGEA